MKKWDSILSGKGQKGQHNFGEIVAGVDAFYSDFRNRPVCWREAVTFVIMSVNGESLGDAELNALRSASAANGCPGDVKSDQ